ncbi:PadR family transcriptional regulator [Psychrobacillus lasiicapitis]|uniref:Helix-turn-helix transcriptional regulator n=1 Tax=Psychrobacillus lasiicapitis TaxID=1636719 RepID=A0A544T592_9BACI|nr:PadR family transcriptional regulator [Psychrobacillus lasiicapitis]TQR12624.1 helix-turn-helix transcriptional regulator [Psychrobacillus lasiicapitis]GGA39608.1 PadR family transcriptional regulator [Psychrobacillus lasiicapitis]
MKKRRGFMQIAILHLLKEGSMHGYQIMKELESRSGGLYSASAGTVYPALQELTEKEMIGLDPDSDKKTYEIKEKGNEKLEEFATRREGEFWEEWKARWVWQNSDEATMLKSALDLWEVEIHKAVKQSRKSTEKTTKLIEFVKEITERLQKENR